MGLLEEWAEWKPNAAPFIFDADRPFFESPRTLRAVVTHPDWQAAHGTDDFAAPGDSRLHLGLLPHPFCGDLSRASVYVLLLNPGLGPTDYYGELVVPKYRDALQSNLSQQFGEDRFPFMFLDPQFAWHGGFEWWQTKLAAVIGELARAWDVTYAAARKRLAAQLASVELLPYHSASFRDADGWLRNLPSVALAREFVSGVVMPRVQRGEAIAIVTRQTKAWNLPEHQGVVAYSAVQARAAHMTPDSPGGRAILTHVLST